jgi:hypothetical protein
MTRFAEAALRVCAFLALGLAACAVAPPVPPVASYQPQVRELVLTTVPLLTKELADTYPFLRADFAPGGVLDGKELYAFMPSSLTVVEGDTLELTFVNPEDDAHDFVLPGLTVPIPAQSVTHASYHATRPGLFSFVCSLRAHRPLMYGQLLVLPAAVGASFSPTESHAESP